MMTKYRLQALNQVVKQVGSKTKIFSQYIFLNPPTNTNIKWQGYKITFVYLVDWF